MQKSWSRINISRPAVADEIISYHREEWRRVYCPSTKYPRPIIWWRRRPGRSGSKEQQEDSARRAAGRPQPPQSRPAWKSLRCRPGPRRPGAAWEPDLHVLMFEELVIRLFPSFLSILLKDLFWTGVLFLLHRHLHQSGALTMDALQDPPEDAMEGMEEAIADKVGLGGRTEARRQTPQPVPGRVLGAVASGVAHVDVRGVRCIWGAGPLPGKRLEHRGSGDGATRAN